jgi:hypothetical protein
VEFLDQFEPSQKIPPPLSQLNNLERINEDKEKNKK